VYVYVCMYVCVCMCVNVCVYVCMYMCAFMHVVICAAACAYNSHVYGSLKLMSGVFWILIIRELQSVSHRYHRSRDLNSDPHI